jgi:hypothetical protein
MKEGTTGRLIIDFLLPHGLQNGKQGDVKNLADANAQAAVESAASGGQA